MLATICAAQVLFDMMSAPFTDDHEEEHAVSTAALARRRAADAVAQKGDRKSRPEIGDAVRKGTPAELRRDVYFFFMEGSWTRLWIVFGGIYLLSNVFFAALYLVEPTSIAMDGDITFADAFFFSVQTMSTIGYGAMHPTTEYGDMIVTVEAAFGLLSVALATGLMFAKASRPTSSVLFGGRTREAFCPLRTHAASSRPSGLLPRRPRCQAPPWRDSETDWPSAG